VVLPVAIFVPTPNAVSSVYRVGGWEKKKLGPGRCSFIRVLWKRIDTLDLGLLYELPAQSPTAADIAADIDGIKKIF
jgi:hypothetical protein